MFETILIIVSILVAIMGVGVATWSIMDTRKLMDTRKRLNDKSEG